MRVTEEQKFYLKQFAAKQFPGSIENLSTKKPIFMLQEETKDDAIPISLDEFVDEFECEGHVFLEYRGTDCSTPEDVVKLRNCVEDLNDEDIAARYDELFLPAPIFPYGEWYRIAAWLNEHDQEGTLAPDDLEEYFEFYGVNLIDVTAYRYTTHWETLAFSFCKSELVKVRESLSNHIYGDTRIHGQAGNSYGRTNGDFYPLYDFLYSTGEELLREEAASITIADKIVRPEKEVLASYRKNERVPSPCEVASFVVKTLSGDRYDVTVTMSGAIHNKIGTLDEYPVTTARMVSVKREDGTEHICPYPFECDATGKALRKESEDKLDNFARLFFYCYYSLAQAEN